MNFVKSTWKGPVFTISISPDGKYHWSDSNSSYSFRCDGQFRSIGGNRTQACTISSATVLDLIRKEKGVTTNSYRWEVSGAGKVYTATSTTVALSHAAPANQVVASRISGSNGFAGQWRNNTYLQQHAEMTLRRDGQYIHINYPNDGLNIDAPLDGTDAKIAGPQTSLTMGYTAQLVGRREIRFHTKNNGKMLTRGSMMLSDDGRLITENWWNPDRPTALGSLVYDKK